MLDVPFQGGCQCRTVRYRGSAPPFVAYTCHCLDCQRLTASAFATCMQVPAESLDLIAGAPRSRVRVADDGNRLTTWFCGDCGSALYTGNDARPRLRTIYVGTLDAAGCVDVSAHIWTRRKLPWVLLPAQHRVFEEAGDWRTDYAADPGRLTR